ncbi:MAG: helix-turn-helix domain-containing protein [Pyrinomonadaceae bacterium]
MNKREVANYLNLSTRAVERAVARGKLSIRYKKDKHGHIALFNPSEVRRYRATLEVPVPRRPMVDPPTPLTPTSPDRPTPLTLGSAITLTEEATEAARGKEGPFVPLADKLTLSSAEASSLSGLSEKFLLQAIRKEKLKAFKDEQDWRIKRADLDAFVRNL